MGQTDVVGSGAIPSGEPHYQKPLAAAEILWSCAVHYQQQASAEAFQVARKILS
jgi:hypothetical protein